MVREVITYPNKLLRTKSKDVHVVRKCTGVFCTVFSGFNYIFSRDTGYATHMLPEYVLMCELTCYVWRVLVHACATVCNPALCLCTTCATSLSGLCLLTE